MIEKIAKIIDKILNPKAFDFPIAYTRCEIESRIPSLIKEFKKTMPACLFILGFKMRNGWLIVYYVRKI